MNFEQAAAQAMARMHTWVVTYAVGRKGLLWTSGYQTTVEAATEGAARKRALSKLLAHHGPYLDQSSVEIRRA